MSNKFNFYYFANVICPSCDGNGCGICHHIGYVKAKIIENKEKLIKFEDFTLFDFDSYDELDGGD